jgi:hypothetical protein
MRIEDLTRETEMKSRNYEETKLERGERKFRTGDEEETEMKERKGTTKNIPPRGLSSLKCDRIISFQVYDSRPPPSHQVFSLQPPIPSQYERGCLMMMPLSLLPPLREMNISRN